MPAAERPGIVYGGFLGNMLADVSSKWLRELLDSNGFKYEDIASGGRRPRVLTAFSSDRDSLWRAWHKLKRLNNEMGAAEEVYDNCPRLWISLDQTPK